MTRTSPIRSTRAVAVVLLLAVALVGAYLFGANRDSSRATGALALTNPTRADSVALAADSTGSTGITVNGTGTATGTPDSLAVDLGLTTTGSNVSAALQAANNAADKVQKVFLARGVAAKDLQTSGLSIQATYDQSGRVVTGYQVTEGLRAVLRGIDTAGATISAAVEAGGNAVRVNGVGLDLADTSALVSKARDAAFAQAKAKAEQYAKAAGVPLGRLVSLTDVQVNQPITAPMAYAAAGKADSAVPIQAGSQDVSVTVTVLFALS